MTATSRDWADAYLAQARADLAGLRALQGTAPSTAAMVAQMVFEKFAKAALLRTGAVHLSWAQSNHGAASRMVQVMRLQKLLTPLGGPWPWKIALQLVSQLEAAHPQLANKHGPQLEYPWQDARGVVRWPAQHLQVAQSVFGAPSSRAAIELLRFAEQLSHHFDDIFG